MTAPRLCIAPAHVLLYPRVCRLTCAVNCAFCCSTANIRCSSAVSAGLAPTPDKSRSESKFAMFTVTTTFSRCRFSV